MSDPRSDENKNVVLGGRNVLLPPSSVIKIDGESFETKRLRDLVKARNGAFDIVIASVP